MFFKNLKIQYKIIYIILIIIFLYSLINIILWFINNKENDNIQKSNQDNIEVVDNKYIINWEELKKKNKDTIAYIKVNNTKIDHVVVKTKNNSYYLRHNFNKKYNRSGWIFADYHNKFDGTDKNIIIYGHNMKNDSMFGTLKNILTKEWYTNEDNYLITLYTEDKELVYQVFSVYSIKAEDYYIETKFNNKTYPKFLETLKKRSIYNFNIDLTDTSQILTLSTCNDTGSKRIVLHAKLIKEQV